MIQNLVTILYELIVLYKNFISRDTVKFFFRTFLELVGEFGGSQDEKKYEKNKDCWRDFPEWKVRKSAQSTKKVKKYEKKIELSGEFGGSQNEKKKLRKK